MASSRPKIFELEQVKADLVRLGVHQHSIEPTISAMRLVIPVVLRELGDKRIIDLLERRNSELGLSENSRWKQIVPDIVAWAKDVLEQYKTVRPSPSANQ